MTRLSMTVCSAWYVVPLFTASRSVRDCISGYCFSKVTFVGSVYWNWKLRPNVRILFGRSTGIPIPTMNWGELGKVFRKRGTAQSNVCVLLSSGGGNADPWIFPWNRLFLEDDSPWADQGITLLLLKPQFIIVLTKAHDWNFCSHLISLRFSFNKFCDFHDGCLPPGFPITICKDHVLYTMQPKILGPFLPLSLFTPLYSLKSSFMLYWLPQELDIFWNYFPFTNVLREFFSW